MGYTVKGPDMDQHLETNKKILNEIRHFKEQGQFGPTTFGQGSPYDYAYEYRMNNQNNSIIRSNESAYGARIASAAIEMIGHDTLRKSPGGYTRTGMVCADAVCDITNEIGIPWPVTVTQDSSIDYIIDAFDGRGQAGKDFPSSNDFQLVNKDNLALGDIYIEDFQGGNNRVEGRVGYQKHMSVIVGVYTDGIVVVHDSNEGTFGGQAAPGSFYNDGPKTSTFLPWEAVDRKYDRAYRYSPDDNNKAFDELMYK